MEFHASLFPLTSQQIACKTWFTAIDVGIEVGIAAIPGLGPALDILIVLASEVAQAIAWSVVDLEAQKAQFAKFLADPNNADVQKAAGGGIMDRVCGNKYTPPEVEKLFNKLQFASNFASAAKLAGAAGKAWPPPWPKGQGTPEDIAAWNKYLLGQGPKPTGSTRGAPKDEPKPAPKDDPKAPPKDEPKADGGKKPPKECTRRNGRRAPVGSGSGGNKGNRSLRPFSRSTHVLIS